MPRKFKRLDSETGPRVPLNMRTTRALRTRLADEANRQGRSLCQEVEYRLEASFNVPDAIAAFVAEYRRQEIESRKRCDLIPQEMIEENS